MDLSAVACHTATSCAAVGSYLDTSGNYHGLLLTWSGTSWTPAAAPLSADAASPNRIADFTSVACPSATSCVTVSTYFTSSGTDGVLVTGWGTSSKATKAPLPVNTAASAEAELFSVTCQSTTSCLAVGQYLDSSGNDQPLLVTGSKATWQSTQAPLPTNAAPPAKLEGAACASTTWCVAAGVNAGGALLET